MGNFFKLIYIYINKSRIYSCSKKYGNLLKFETVSNINCKLHVINYVCEDIKYYPFIILQIIKYILMYLL